MFELRTLGSLELLRNGDGDPRAISMQAKRLALLAHLAVLPPNTFRRRDTLLLLFWPELDQEHARGALRQALHFLRKTLGDGAIVTRGEDEIGLDASLVRSDARGLEAALAAGDAEGALALYKGDFLDGVFVSDAAPELEDWISGERLRLRLLAAKSAWLAAELPANRDRVGELVRQAVQWSGDDEGALRRGLKALDGMGDHAGAVALYDEFARRVARDLNVEPSTETRSVIKALRARRASGRHAVSSPPSRPTPVATVREPTLVAAPARRPGKRLLLAGIGGALLVLALAASIGPRRGAPPVSKELLAVMPFRVPADSSLTWLSDGIVDLLTIRLGGVGGPRVTESAAVLSQWHHRATDRANVPHDASVDIARQLGAGRVIEGSLTGTRERLTLSASLSSVSGSTPVKRAVVEGSADSVPQMVDRLAAQLLGMSAGMEGAQLASLASASLPAIRLFVAGQAAFRKGRLETAVQRFSEAIELDSTFALAGLWLLRATIWTGTAEQGDLGRRTAMAGRDRLSPADQALLDAHTMERTSTSAGFAVLDKAVQAYPDRPETWYRLGDAHFHQGALAGEEGWAERAEQAFQQGWLLDSAAGIGALGEVPIAEPMLHFVELASMRHDTAGVLRLTSSVLAADSTSELGWTLKWHRALVTSDSARAVFWTGIGAAPQKATMHIILFIEWTGVGLDDQDRARAADDRILRAHDPGYANFAFMVGSLNEGRPDDALRALARQRLPANRMRRTVIRTALSWDGDTAAALQSVRALSTSIAGPASGEAERQRLFDACTAGEWQAARGDYAGAARAIAQLRAARVDSAMTDAAATGAYVTLCTSLLEAMHASGMRLPGARARVAVADSLARELSDAVCCDDERIGDANIQLARLWEREGDPAAALRAIARRSSMFVIAPTFMSTFLREEGRLAAMTGDTARAVDAYRRYLAFRESPQASLKPGVDSVRQQLAVLETGQPPRRSASLSPTPSVLGRGSEPVARRW